MATGLWPLRRRFWNAFAVFKYRHNKPDVITVPVDDDKRLRTVPLVSLYPTIPVKGVEAADRIPADESKPAKRMFSRLQARMYRVLSPMEDALPTVDADVDAALATAYTRKHRACFPPPVRPDVFDGETDLGRVAVASPFAGLVERRSDGAFVWDLAMLDRFECHTGLRPPAAVVHFVAVSDGDNRDDSDDRDDSDGIGGGGGDGQRLTATRIDSDLGWTSPDDAAWPEAQRLAMCAATTYLSLVRHFNWVHLAAGSAMAVATRNELPAAHPLRRLLWPHVYGTQYSNDLITLDQMTNGGDFESIFSFTHQGVADLIDATFADFDLRLMHPGADLERRRLAGAGVATPASDNRAQLYNVFEAHCRRYLDVYYDSDSGLAADEAFCSWLDALDRTVPGGVRAVAGADVTLDGAARLLATLIQLATVEHEVVGSGVWDYQMWIDAAPVRVANTGAREPVDVYQRLVNANFNLNVHRTALLTDFSSLAVDAAGADAFRRFRCDLFALEGELERLPPEPWRMLPGRLKANINA